MKKMIAAALSFASVGAFAADAGMPAMDVSVVVDSIKSIGPSVALVGGAVLALAAVTYGYRVIKGFIGR
ncbi:MULTISPECIES: major capsid protein [pseudomallei group]|uniref:Membrane protein n=3 Tax=pseudomallei group TaxID=111527 RepID=A0AAI8FR59_9BURK|nr:MULTISPECIES: major capsid protein [pseudomallei group]AIO65161.1 putative membrane protein [Burkholderia oklahomensis]AIO69597.1 putative membrane protein [Burkholderia oklahomensis]AIP62358.1 coat protein [Burkholderia thailandensis]AIP64181.1 coat protein [Burkholderia thailandensis]AJX30592.1 putative membrane protein [Burkholderia oklahomensis C6786]